MMIGHFIRSERLKKNIKQSYLAKGICSPSYLSKIENNSTEPSEEILYLISKKLGIELNIKDKNLDNLNHEKINRQYLNEIYKEISIKRSEKYAKQVFNELSDLRLSFNDNDFYLYCLVNIRILVILKDNKSILSLLNPLMRDKEKLNNFESYLLAKILGIFNFVNNNLKDSIGNFEEAMNISKHINLPSWDQADLYYMYSLASLSNQQNVKAIEYSEMSLKFFNENFLFERSIESLIIQGIAYKNSLDYKASLKSYKKAIEITEKFDIYKFKSIIFQNLGSLHTKLNDYNLALEYYLKSLELKNNLDKKLITILSIIQIYSRLKEFHEMNMWIQKGFEEISGNNEYEQYIIHFNVYKLLGEGDIEKIELYLPKAIQYFEKIKDYRHTYKYCIKMALMLKNVNRYKNATIYFEKALYHQNAIKEITTWEDI
ncbi:helix-turn-helix domain-containing protein [Lysinibacillus sp. S2017]|uniref:helix-turn-helix domain-containing protein n=1 Tax=Lysinibacillus sp. S2017 TaxID=2561923 RepID=UPI001091C6D0|nr:helix-turn-helix domain-containing protein [Lysinibacillus sp. S2017]TGN33090.1 helix-turn-helix domain-containing protein [Lysinibacillus sp. S2017]